MKLILSGRVEVLRRAWTDAQNGGICQFERKEQVGLKKNPIVKVERIISSRKCSFSIASFRRYLIYICPQW